MEPKIVATTAERINEALSITGKKQIDLATESGIDKSSISLYASGKYSPKSDKIFLMAKAFGVSPEWLMGFDVPMYRDEINIPTVTPKEEKDIERILAQAKEQLMAAGTLMFDGEPATQEDIEAILSAMEVGVALAKKKAREKYTPKKYRK